MEVKLVRGTMPWQGLPKASPAKATEEQTLRRGREIAHLEEKAHNQAVAAGVSCPINFNLNETEQKNYLMAAGKAYQFEGKKEGKTVKSSIAHSTADIYTSMYNDFEKAHPQETKMGNWPKPAQNVSGGGMDLMNNLLMPFTLIMFLGQMLVSPFIRGQVNNQTAGIQPTTQMPSGFTSNPLMAANAANN
ncbi:MAG: hypothetical protein SFU25_03740 [Candidatus Caenarcaniphilales bacterium]|nr:hypothetical protein [Candidatus Caenarcaniphilales bacterium]